MVNKVVPLIEEKFFSPLKKYKDFLYAFLVFLPTIIGVSEVYFILLIPCVLFFESDQLKLGIKNFLEGTLSRVMYFRLVLMLLILILSLINKVFNGNEIFCLKDYYSAFYLFPFSLLVGFFIGTKKVFKFILIFLSIETIFGVIEYFVGYRSLFISYDLASNVIDNKELLYDSRVYGLSYSSSIFAYKVLVGVLLLEYLQLKKYWAVCFRIFLLLALLLTFNRTVIVVALLYWSLLFLKYSLDIAVRKKWKELQVSYISIAIIGVFLFVFKEGFSYQLGRGGHQSDNVNASVAFRSSKFLVKGTDSSGTEIDTLGFDRQYEMNCMERQAIDLLSVDSLDNPELEEMIHALDSVGTSGRKIIWFNYLSFVWKNPWFGNGSDKLYLRSWQPKKEEYHLMHAHNSYFQILATNGVLITVLYLLFYLSFLNKKNILPLLVFLTYSLGQYGVFWGMSFGDLFFIVFLFYPTMVKANGR